MQLVRKTTTKYSFEDTHTKICRYIMDANKYKNTMGVIENIQYPLYWTIQFQFSS